MFFKNIPSGHVPPLPEWASGVHYLVGMGVTYGDGTYRCLQEHTSTSRLTPSRTPAYWQELT